MLITNSILSNWSFLWNSCLNLLIFFSRLVETFSQDHKAAKPARNICIVYEYDVSTDSMTLKEASFEITDSQHSFQPIQFDENPLLVLIKEEPH